MFKKYIPMTEANCYVLLSIAIEKKHGYSIMKHVKELTNEQIVISNGTLYGILSRMLEDQLIEVEFTGEKKVYQVTKLGLEIIAAEKKRLELLLSNFDLL